VRSEFYPLVADFVRKAVGARRVIVFDHTFRTKINEAQQTAEHTTTQRAPVMIVHCDYTPMSGPSRVRHLLPEEAEALLRRRVAFYNVFRGRRRGDQRQIHQANFHLMRRTDVLGRVADRQVDLAERFGFKSVNRCRYKTGFILSSLYRFDRMFGRI
jgi:hypothetical protein